MPLAMATTPDTAEERSPAVNERVSVFEGMSVELQPAPFWKRFFAYAVDLGVVGAMMYLLLIVGAFLFLGGALVGGIVQSISNASKGTAVGMILALCVVLLAFLAIYHGYFVYFEFKTGQTPGKKLFGLKVIPTRANRLTLGQVVMRDFFRYIDCGLILPGLISMAVTERKQRIGDLVCATLVVYSKSREERQKYLYVKQEDFDYLRELLAPLPVPEEIGRQFLHVAYPIFILGRTPTHPEDLAPWEELARSYLPGAKNQDLDRTTVLLFFAEHCFQTHYRTQNS
jgi:uncharacterized RDD family membrane protein YckC